MNNRLAITLSVVFHPLLLTTYLFLLLFFVTPDLLGVNAFELTGMSSLLLLIFVNTFVVPAVTIFYMHKARIISSLQVDNLAERRLPYLMCVLVYALATYLFGWKLEPIAELAPKIAVILGSVTVSLFVVFAISLTWKVSAHATGIGGAIAMLSGMIIRFNETALLPSLLATILIGGCVLSARLQLNAHNSGQILAGFLCGAAVSSATVYFFF
ncbi:hypothetical protein [Dyadobacter sandarakinus]|uniref:PAP2 superfamily protein n=1 Tax=Dyadobacter sandarakinus TaxID=2747268 RepID=A0ABX7I9F4_9BACT|nr:hypothetical protein [Dyadobacter sandarakinus]QRR02410.1 hypothetical protein HWI92_16575 [Dyadobacter sandarakinus]